MNNTDIELLKPYLKKCYSLYSNFNVACMLVLPDNKYYYGVNVENCSYSLTTCAEKNCITSAITDGADLTDALYMLIITDTAPTITPCGACRQVLGEFFDDTFIIYSHGTNELTQKYTLGELLPSGFIK